MLPRRSKASSTSNDDERRIVIEILCHCGIIQPHSVTALSEGWTDYFAQPVPLGALNDWAFPVNAWHGGDGINEDAVLRVFARLA